MGNTNSNMHKAKTAKNDEFYTMLTDIEKEMKYYRSQFRGKTIYCNCDDARESNFFKYFSLNFEFLGLKKLITTSYNENGKGTILIYNGDKNGNRKVEDSEIEVRELKGNGDFRSDECIEFLKEADIVVTNPPFSIFREYFAQLMEYDKKFCIIGNMNAITYKEFFPYIMQGKVWVGKKHLGTDMFFNVPEDYKEELMNTKTEGGGWKILDGVVVGRVASACWFTNLDTNKIADAPTLICKYNENDYPKYDNYNAINCDKVNKIPYDYDGVIGVPITIADKICDDGLIHFDVPMLEVTDSKYKIIGCADADIMPNGWKGMSKEFVDLYYEQGNTGSYKEGNRLACYISNNGKAKVPFKRVLIQKVN